MSRMSMRDQAVASAATGSQQGRPRASGDVTTPPTPGTPRGQLLALLQPNFVSLPPDSLVPDAMVTAMLADDPEATKTKMRMLFCTAPGPLYCEAEKTAWVTAHPWCNAALVELTPPPTFVDEVTRSAWIVTHPTCPAPPPVLTDHSCTPGDPACDPQAAPASTGGVGLFLAGAAALGIAWWMYESGKAARGNPTDDDGVEDTSPIAPHPELVEELSHWHSSQWDPIYAVMSSWNAGKTVPAHLVDKAHTNILREIRANSESSPSQERKANIRELKHLEKRLGDILKKHWRR